ncbi:disease resistance protein At4g27190-like [Rhodamnia argentea]|uniref:Disease resistance protein At4g27190-like n=1 Tax=Rhodamnia argentea TaxID=178133 RepID=A0ABM3HGH8_9MYRT|nr:disease resistance protein At4g27190-like [Rhodamnia argentea]
MAEIVLSIAAKVAEYLVAPAGHHCGYLIFSNSYAGQLKEELENLENSRQRVQHSIDEALNNMKLIEPDVKKWVTAVETIASKARIAPEHDGRVKKTCFCRWLPNPKERYCLGRDARKTVSAIQELIQQGKFERVYYERDPSGLVGGAPDVNLLAGDGDDSVTDSRASIFQGIMKALDDEKLKVIGVYGPGGVGKTTLLEEVEKKLRKEGRPFQMIVNVKVSRTPDLNNIQGQVADALKLDLKDKQSQQGRRDLLFQRLQRDPNEKVLIILDDLWDKLDLDAVGIPSGDVSSKCKLLLTSRIKNVLTQQMCADPTFHLKGLEDEEAVRLFEKTVGDRVKDEEELKSIAAQVATKLAGLPLLIISVATALKNSNVGAWRNALVKIDVKKMETIVQLSYDHLQIEEARSLYLLCGLIGGTISVETLLILGMGLGLFEEFRRTMQDSRDRLDTMLSELRSACLLLEGGDDKENVTIHDLYSEVVVSTPFRDQNSLIIHDNCGTWPKGKLDECRACLVNDGNDRLVELMPRRFPHAKMLMLSGQHDMGDCSKKYFKDMKELRALCLCSRSITSLPSPTENLGNLQSLIINCHLKDVAILGNLMALQILSFAGYTISRLPKKIGELTNLRSLNIGRTNGLIIEPGVLEGLINLEELNMKGRYHQWMKEDDISSSLSGARLAELKSLTKLTSLEISISRCPHLLEDDDLPVRNLIRFFINIGDAGGRGFKGLSTIKLDLREWGNVLSREWIQVILQKTQYLYLSWLSEFRESAHELCTRGFRELKHLDIEDSSSIKYIANSSNDLRLTAFTKLESLFLKNLINLEKICHGTIAPECFGKLKAVSIKNCDRLKYLWRLSEIRGLAQLEEIEVWGCESMRALIRDDTGEGIADADRIAELPNVRRLKLGWLPNMTSFCTETETPSEGTPIQVSFPRLESLEMVGLLDVEKILYSQSPLEYVNLESIEIRKSQSTSSILKSELILKLPNLKSMKIKSSQSIKVVFDLEELTVAGHVEILSQLEMLTLRTLPNVHRMWKHDVKLQGISVFRNLEKLEVSDTGLAFLFPLSVAKCLRVIRDIRVDDCPNMKAVIMDEEGRDEGRDDIIELPLLERLCIRSCPTEKFFSYPHGKKESIATTSDSQDACSDSFFDRKVSLPSLKELELVYVRSFKRIWNDELPTSSFCELATLALGSCYDLLHVFPSTIIGRLHNLKRVKVSSCPNLESLFDCGSLDSNTEQTRVLLPRLASIFVFYCHSLKLLFDCGSLDSNTELLLPKLEEVRVMLAERLRHMLART